MSNKGRHYQKYQVKISQGKSNGRSKEHLYKVWLDMKARCYCPTQTSYKHYGKRGIRVCSDWYNSYEAFKKWAINIGYQDGLGLEIDRIDVDGHYEPSNCRFLTRTQNMRNRRNTVYINYNGTKKCLAEVCELTGKSPYYIRTHYSSWLYNPA